MITDMIKEIYTYFKTDSIPIIDSTKYYWQWFSKNIRYSMKIKELYSAIEFKYKEDEIIELDTSDNLVYVIKEYTVICVQEKNGSKFFKIFNNSKRFY